MIKKLAKVVERPFQKLFGVELILEDLRKVKREIKAQQFQLDKANSYLEFATIDEERMRGSEKFKIFSEIIPLLSPMDIKDGSYRRVGRDYDGGYVMFDDLSCSHIDAAYSFGISDDVSWDVDIAELGIKLYMYDHTISELPRQHSRFNFFNEGVTGNSKEEGLETLSNLMLRNGHLHCRNLILKMDIEGNEWNVLQETPSNVFNQFKQIIIEYHGLNLSNYGSDLPKVLGVLRKLNKTHQSVHVHANGRCPVSWLGNMVLPDVLEVTYIRRKDYNDRLIQNTRTFPTVLDRSTFSRLPEVPLGLFTVNYESLNK